MLLVPFSDIVTLITPVQKSCIIQLRQRSWVERGEIPHIHIHL